MVLNKDKLLEIIKTRIKVFIKNLTWKKIKKTLIIAVSVYLVVLFLSVILFFTGLKDKGNASASTPGLTEPVNILVLGMDIGSVSDQDNESIKRTDTMMVINYNPDTRSTQIVSIPRDTLVTENGKNYKANAAYVKGGATKAKQVVENILSININYVVNIDYTAFRDFIDSIGGVKMKINRDMLYDDDSQNLHINFKNGTTVKLNGQKAEEFFRWRKNNDGTGFANGDIDRIQNQHDFIEQVEKKIKSPFIIFRIPFILAKLGGDIDTNMSAASIIYDGIRIAMSKGTFNMTTLQGTPKTISGQSYYIIDKNSNKDLLSSLKSSAKKDTTSEIDKSRARVLVLNGTSKDGLASQVKSQLSGYGFEKVETGNTDSSKKSYIETDNSSLSSSLKEILVNIKNTKSKPTDSNYSGYDVVIILGDDYK